jgi:ABC-type dipeptide/oligopeptide/nickel transport system permease subunit
MAIGESEPVLSAAGSNAMLPSRSAQILATEELQTKQLTQAQFVWIRFRRHRLAMVGSAIFLFMVLIAIFAPIIAPDNIYDQNASLTSTDFLTSVDKAPACVGDFHSCFKGLFGTNFNGQSEMSQVLWGARFSLLIGITSAVLSTIIGIVVGSVSGFFGGWTDSVLMRIVDVFLTLPFLPVLIAAAGIVGGGHTSVLLVIGIFIFFGWAYIARLVRGQFLSLRTLEYIEAARAVGVSTSRIIFRHMLPNSIRPILVATTLAIAFNIVGEAALDFLGVGLQYPDTSWGSVLAFAENEQFRYWWLIIIPGMFLTVTVVSINFIGDGLSDALDVRQRL